MQTNKQRFASFETSIAASIGIGVLSTCVYYSMIFTGLLSFATLRRFTQVSFGAGLVVCLAAIATTYLVRKWWNAGRQQRLAAEALSVLDELAVNSQATLAAESWAGRPSHDGESRAGRPSHVEEAASPAQWLDTLWRTQKSAIYQSMFGQCVERLLARQLQRRGTRLLDADFSELRTSAHLSLADSHGFLKTIQYAMVGVGFASAILCIASGIPNALMPSSPSANITISSQSTTTVASSIDNRSTYFQSACDTLALTIVLSVAVQCGQFIVVRREKHLVESIHTGVADCLRATLAEPIVNSSESYAVQATTANRITLAGSDELIGSVQQLVQTQATIWRETIDEAGKRWTQLTADSTETVKLAIGVAIEEALAKHAASIASHVEQMTKLQAEGALQIDSRLQQWQTTLSEQTRSVHRQQHEINRQTELLQGLIDSGNLVAAMEKPLQATLNRLTDVDRFHDAAVCLTEAVAVLGTQMERYGYLGRQPVRRKSLEGNEPAVATAPANVAALPTKPALSLFREQSADDVVADASDSRDAQRKRHSA